MQFPWTKVDSRITELELRLSSMEHRIKELLRAHNEDVIKVLQELSDGIQAVLEKLDKEPTFTVEGVMDKTVAVLETAVKLKTVDLGMVPQIVMSEKQENELVASLVPGGTGVEIMKDETDRSEAEVEAWLGREE